MILTKIRTQIKWILAAFLAAFVLAIPMMYGVGGSGGSKSDKRRDHPVARIEGHELMLSDLYKAMQSYVEQNNIPLASLTEEDMPMIYQQTLDSLATRMALDKAIKERGIAPSDDEVKEQLKNIEVQYVTKEAFMVHLKATGSTIEKVKENIARDLAIRQLLTQVGQEATVPDEQVKNLYDLFVTIKQPIVYRPAGVEGHHAEFRTQEAAEEFIEKIKAGKPWKDSADEAGDLKIVATDGKLTSFVSDADVSSKFDFIAKLADGQMSGPEKIADDDYLVFSRIKATEERTAPYEEAEPQIKALALKQAQHAKQQEYMGSLLKTVNVEILDPEIFPKPKTETPAVDGPKAEETAEEPKTDNGVVESPKNETPAPEEGKVETPADETPKAEEGAVQASETDGTTVETPKTETEALVDQVQEKVHDGVQQAKEAVVSGAEKLADVAESEAVSEASKAESPKTEDMAAPAVVEEKKSDMDGQSSATKKEEE